MPKKPKVELPTQGDLFTEIEDMLGDTCLKEPRLVCITASKPRSHLLPGYYIHYRIWETDLDRAVYLGNNVREIQRKFNEWVKKWMVQ